MFWYFAIFSVLLALALLEGGLRSRWPGYACGVVLALMAGLRYETGFDWADYERHYFLTPPFGATNIYASITTIMVEPGYELLARVLRSTGAGFQVMIFICGAFSMFALTRLAARFSPLIGIVLLWYYGFLFLPGPLATMRQTLSVAFVYLALIAMNDRRVMWAVIWSGLALSFHFYSISFLPIVFWLGRRPGFRVSLIAAVAGFAISTVGNNLFASVTDIIVAMTGGGFVADKMSTYASFVGAQISPLSLALVLWHLGFMWLVERRQKGGEYIVDAAMLAAFISIVLHSLFAPFPIMWNRMMLVAFPLEAIALCRIYYISLSRLEVRSAAIGLAGLGSALALTYALWNEQSLVYEPYQNLAVTWVRGPYGNGRMRYQYIRQINDQLFLEQKAR